MDQDAQLAFQYAKDGDIENLLHIVQTGFDPNTQDAIGFTPLHWCVFHGNENAILPLLLAGSDPNIQSTAGFSCLMLTISMNIPFQIFKLLLFGGADPNIRNTQNKSSIDLAKENRKPNYIKEMKLSIQRNWVRPKLVPQFKNIDNDENGIVKEFQDFQDIQPLSSTSSIPSIPSITKLNSVTIPNHRVAEHKPQIQDRTCSFCTNVLINLEFSFAVVSPCCNRINCRSCMEKWLSTFPICPHCRLGLSKSKLRPISRMEYLWLGKVVVKCINHNVQLSRSEILEIMDNGYGCPETGSFEEMKIHSKTCPFTSLWNSSCNVVVMDGIQADSSSRSDHPDNPDNPNVTSDEILETPDSVPQVVETFFVENPTSTNTSSNTSSNTSLNTSNAKNKTQKGIPQEKLLIGGMIANPPISLSPQVDGDESVSSDFSIALALAGDTQQEIVKEAPNIFDDIKTTQLEYPHESANDFTDFIQKKTSLKDPKVDETKLKGSKIQQGDSNQLETQTSTEDDFAIALALSQWG